MYLFFFPLPSCSSSFLLSAKPVVWRPSHGSNDASCDQWGSPPAVFLRYMGRMKAAAGAQTGRHLVQPVCIRCACPHSVRRSWGMGGPGGKDTGMLPHFTQFFPQIRCISCDWGLWKWVLVNLAGLFLLVFLVFLFSSNLMAVRMQLQSPSLLQTNSLSLPLAVPVMDGFGV